RLVKQHHVVPLRTLGLVHGEYVTVVELVVRLAALPIDMLDATRETFRPYGDLHAARCGVVVRQQSHRHDSGFYTLASATHLDRPQPAVEQTFLAVVAQAHQLVAGRRHVVLESAPFAHAFVVRSSRDVAPDQDLIG